ncbi:hypothetical protein ACVXZ0_02625 [Staphylococcus aureus]
MKDQNKKSFINAIEKEPKLANSAEIKSKSPTVNDLPERDLSQQIQIMKSTVQMPLSILTDEKYFGGSFERLSIDNKNNITRIMQKTLSSRFKLMLLNKLVHL